jgi:hypothetical protein
MLLASSCMCFYRSRKSAGPTPSVCLSICVCMYIYTRVRERGALLLFFQIKLRIKSCSALMGVNSHQMHVFLSLCRARSTTMMVLCALRGALLLMLPDGYIREDGWVKENRERRQCEKFGECAFCFAPNEPRNRPLRGKHRVLFLF